MVFMPGVPLRLYQSEERERERERVQTSDGLLYLGHRPKYKPQNTKLNYAHRQTNKTYKKQDTQTNDKYQQTKKQKREEKQNKTKADQTVTQR